MDQVMPEVGEGDDRLKVVYIAGSQRGGTTILARVLGSLPGFAFGGELRRLWTLIGRGLPCGCGQPYSRCPIWSAILDEGGGFEGLSPKEIEDLQRLVAPSEHSAWQTLRVLHRAKLTPEQERYVGLTKALYRSFAQETGTSVLVDSSKIPIDPALLLRSSDVTVFCLHVVRDPRGAVFAAHLGRGETLQETARILEEDRHRALESKQVRLWRTLKTSAAWNSRHVAAAAVRRRYGSDRGSLVRYEDFVRDPQHVLARISSLVGHASAVEGFDPNAIVLPGTHNPSRTGRSTSGSVALREDDRWQRHLSAIDKGLTSVMTLPLARRFGYMTNRRDGSDRN